MPYNHIRGCLKPPQSYERRPTLLWGSFHSVGSATTRGFAQAQTFRFGPPWLGIDMRTLAHSHIPSYMKQMEWFVAGCNTVMVERMTELSMAFLPVDMAENIDCSSHLTCTFISLWYRRGDDWEVRTCQLTSGTCPSTTRDLRDARGLKFHYRF